MAYNKINWEAGEVSREGYVLIDGVQYQTVQPEYTGNTPINPANLNHMDEGIKEAHDNIDATVLNTGAITSTGGTLTQSIKGFKRLKIFYHNDGNIYKSLELYNNNASSITGDLITCAVGGGEAYERTAQVKFNGTSVSIINLYMLRIRNNNYSLVTQNTGIFTIDRIEGYLQ